MALLPLFSGRWSSARPLCKIADGRSQHSCDAAGPQLKDRRAIGATMVARIMLPSPTAFRCGGTGFVKHFTRPE
jgi:hypothetical protein